MNSRYSKSRRSFLKQSSILVGSSVSGLSFPWIAKAQSPNDKIQIAAIGTGGRAAANVAGASHEAIVAMSDVDSNMLDATAKKLPDARQYKDFRIMLEKEADRIDAVLVGTPDHTHAPAAAMAMRMGKHVYCEKPLTHTVHEARVLSDLAKQKGLVTQMGTQIHAGNNYRRVVELVQSGAIGKVERVHVWVNIGSSYSDGKFTTNTQAPLNLDWDLWLGPATERPYSEGVHPSTWRNFWDYGNGRLGDFGCHYMDLAHWALNLRQPTRIETEGPEVESVTTPRHLKVDYYHPAIEKRSPVHLTWYGNRTPDIVKTLKDSNGKPLNFGSGQLFVGEKGMIISNYGEHRLLPESTYKEFERPDEFIPNSIGHHKEWTEAIRNGGNTTCNFDYAGALTETVLLGSVSYRSGEDIDYIPETATTRKSGKARNMLHKEYRKGWTL
ncbi:MAG: Gfo/Idh/MocA family protein [Limisphaerales bacterium]|nr:MAG: Gfo/Idh/MocA family oxidoreductase [Limisphaerales bacterium]HAW01246.1 oxidoreductase [Verrucomicrobiales bacterium]HCP37152.1 oxidoreductase [Verrucomicrobiales bacterium]